MMKYFVAALCLMAVAICEAGVSRSWSAAKVVNQELTSKSNPFGVVEGIIPCGMAGTIIQVRVTDCTAIPCVLVSGGLYIFEIDFQPSLSHPGLDLKVLLLNDGDEHHIIDGSVPDSAVEAGGTYTFTYPITVEGFIQGLSQLRIEISGSLNGRIELCGLAVVDVVPAIQLSV